LMERFRMALFGGFAGLSILLAVIGMYSVTSYAVAQRSYEFALRIALGANRSQVLTMVLRSGFIVASIGVVVGIGISLGAVRLMAALMNDVKGIDVVAFTLAGVMVLALATVAALLPARRAASVDPMKALRNE